MALEVFDLYCGMGGLSVGFKRARFKVCGGIDHWQPAVDIYSEFVDRPVYPCKVSDADSIITESGWSREEGILIGGPPCQGFSLANQRRGEGWARAREMRSEIFNYLELIDRMRPVAFLLENVGGMRNTSAGDKQQAAARTISEMVHEEYTLQVKLLDASDYGVPQHRRRIFFIGVRKDLLNGRNLSMFPEPTHYDFSKTVLNVNEKKGIVEAMTDETRTPTWFKERWKEGVLSGHPLEGRLPAVSVRECIGDLPKLEPGERSEVPNHCAGQVAGLVRRRLMAIPPGGSAWNLPPELREGLDMNRIWYHYKRMNWVCRPGPAIPCEIRAGNGYAHPTQPRAITVREAARLQGIGDDFVFNTKQSDAYRLIGNVVPTRLSEVIANGMLEGLQALTR